MTYSDFKEQYYLEDFTFESYSKHTFTYKGMAGKISVVFWVNESDALYNASIGRTMMFQFLRNQLGEAHLAYVNGELVEMDK